MPQSAQRSPLTDRFVASLKPAADDRFEIADSGLPGLSLRVSARSKVFWFRYRRPDSTQARLRLGHYVAPEHAKDDPNALTVAGARMKARKLRTSVDDGLDPSAAKKAAKAEAKAQPIKTLDDLAEAFFAVCESGEYRPARKVKKASTLVGERYSYKTYVKTDLGDVRVEDVTRDAVRTLLRGLVKRGAGVTSNRVRALLHAMFRFAITEERVATNPVAMIPRLVAEAPRERIVSDNELKAIWSALSNPTAFRMPNGTPLQVGLPVRLALKLATLTMQRRSEIAGMRVSDVDLESGLWVLPAESTKSGRQHTVPLGAASLAIIKDALAIRAEDDTPSPFVFPGRNDRKIPIAGSALSQAMRDIRSAIGIDDVTVHDLRRSCSSRLADAGINPHSISLCMNHTGGSGAAAITMRVYVRASFMPERTHAMLTLERLILETVGEREAVGNVVALRG